MKPFDMCETHVVYTKIGDFIYARSAASEDFQKKGIDHLQETFGCPAVKTGRHTWQVDDVSYVCRSGRQGDKYYGTWESADGKKHGGMASLYNLCLWQMDLLPREQQLLVHPIFPLDDRDIHTMYALAVWMVAVRRMRRGVTYPQDTLDLAEKAAKEAAAEIHTQVLPRPQFPIPLESGWYVADSASIPGAERKVHITRDGESVYADPAHPTPVSRGEMEEYAYVRAAGRVWRVSSLDPWN